MSRTRTQTPPQPPLHARQAHRAACSFSTASSSSSISTASSAASSPSSSTLITSRTTSVPFSWEHHPGIPKRRSLRGGSVPKACSPPSAAPLPLPPPLRRGDNGRPLPSGGPGADPFAAALAKCTRDHVGGTIGTHMDALFPATPASAAAAAGRSESRRWSIAAKGIFGFLDLYGCKNAMAVVDGAFVVRRPVVPPVNRAGPGTGPYRPGWTEISPHPIPPSSLGPVM